MVDFPVAIKKLIAGLERLPGIGPKGASRLVFYLLNTPESYVMELSSLLADLKHNVKTCQKCFGVAERELCSICADTTRRQDLICVVEGSIDVMALEAVDGYKGVYHVLGGAINPLDHVGPDDLKIMELVERVTELVVGSDARPADSSGVPSVEIILATNPTMEGEATALYIKNRLEKIKGVSQMLKISRIGSGLPMGASLEYADQATLGRALEGRRGY